MVVSSFPKVQYFFFSCWCIWYCFNYWCIWEYFPRNYTLNYVMDCHSTVIDSLFSAVLGKSSLVIYLICHLDWLISCGRTNYFPLNIRVLGMIILEKSAQKLLDYVSSVFSLILLLLAHYCEPQGVMNMADQDF